MKVIDLLNKIAKGEEVPNKIKYDVLERTKGYVYTYSKEDKDYTRIDELNEKEYLFTQIFLSTKTDLNDEVEIIEEEKNIEELVCCMNYFYEKDIHNAEEDMKTVVLKINELVREVNKLKNKE